jgi:siroheme synthase-like protein
VPPPPSGAYFPVSLDVAGRPCLVVGGGPVAARKAAALLACGARVTVVAPEVGEAMARLTALAVERRPYRAGEAAGYRLVITATGRAEVDGAVFADAESAGVWVNSADDREHSSFILPSVHRDGAVTVAVSTSGSSPALATWLRGRLADQVGGRVGELARLLAAARRRLHEEGRSTESVDWAALLDGPLPALVEAGRLDEARALVAAAAGVSL